MKIERRQLRQLLFEELKLLNENSSFDEADDIFKDMQEVLESIIGKAHSVGTSPYGPVYSYSVKSNVDPNKVHYIKISIETKDEIKASSKRKKPHVRKPSSN